MCWKRLSKPTAEHWVLPRRMTLEISSSTKSSTTKPDSIESIKHITCLNVNKGFSFVEQLWPNWLEEEARAIKGEGDRVHEPGEGERGHEAGDAGLVGLSHIKLSWCWLLIWWDWLWLKFNCLRRWKRFTSSRTFASICSNIGKGEKRTLQ